MSRKLTKSRKDVKVDGVCAGIAEFFGIDSTAIRLAFVVFVLFGGSGILLYIVCALIMPREPEFSEVSVQDVKDVRDNKENYPN